MYTCIQPTPSPCPFHTLTETPAKRSAHTDVHIQTYIKKDHTPEKVEKKNCAHRHTDPTAVDCGVTVSLTESMGPGVLTVVFWEVT